MSYTFLRMVYTVTTVDVKEPDPGLPASIEAAWGRRERSTKGPKPGLSLERIVEAAVGVARSDGLEAVSMSRVAAELGASTMSLYRYVAAKDELLALMVDAAMADASSGAADGGSWRHGLAEWAWGYHRILRRHPWILRIPIASPPLTPNMTTWLEHGLRALGPTGLSEPEKLSVMLLLSGFVRNEATVIADLGNPEQDIMPVWGRRLEALTDPERFPALHAALGSEAFDADDDPDAEFVFGLERILDGVAALVDARS